MCNNLILSLFLTLGGPQRSVHIQTLVWVKRLPKTWLQGLSDISRTGDRSGTYLATQGCRYTLSKHLPWPHSWTRTLEEKMRKAALTILNDRKVNFQTSGSLQQRPTGRGQMTPEKCMPGIHLTCFHPGLWAATTASLSDEAHHMTWTFKQVSTPPGVPLTANALSTLDPSSHWACSTFPKCDIAANALCLFQG